MLYSGNLLKRYLSLPIESEIIADQLTMKTCEIEEHHEREIPELVVIGKVAKVEKHPDADKLVVCQLDCGAKGQWQICTGGENVVENSYVPVALPGCHLPAINLSIEPRKMRGLESNGMICSKEELGIPEDIDEHWIWTLQYGDKTNPADMVQEADMDDITEEDLGMPLRDKYPWLENRILDVENKTITHRPDMFGHFGLSVELHSIFGKAAPSFVNGQKYMEQMQHGSVIEMLTHAKQSDTRIHAKTDNCQTYTLIELNNVEVKRSDLYMRVALYDLGLQPRNNWVDFSNLFMYLTGQPIHFFDANKIAGDITIRQAKAGEPFMDLFDKEHELLETDVVIADSKSVIALAGVVGGHNSGVEEGTTKIYAEIGNFDEVAVRKTGTRLGLRTDAELRFEKYINPLFSLHAVTMLLDELQYSKKSLGNFEIGGLSRWINDHDPQLVRRQIPVNFEAMENMISGQGIENFETKARTILADLGYDINHDNVVSVPIWRSPDDCEYQADIVEEIARMIGFDNIPEEILRDPTKFVSYSKEVRLQRNLEELLVGTGHFDQVETYPWIHQRWIDAAKMETDSFYEMANALSPEQRFLRPTMAWHIVEVLEKNAPMFDKLRVFDIGQTWMRDRGRDEHQCLALGMWTKDQSSWGQSAYLHMKSILDTIMTHLGISDWSLKPTEHGFFHPRQQAEVYVGETFVGHIGTLHAFWSEQSKLPSEAPFVVAELDLTNLADLAYQPNTQAHHYETLADQIVWRDLSFVVDQGEPFVLLANALKSVEAIEDVNVFDIYGGDKLPQGKKSIGFRVKIKGDGNMKTEEINEVLNQAVAAVEEAGYELRK